MHARLVELGGGKVSAGKLGGDRAGEIRITMVRGAPRGLGVALHPVLAVDALEGTVLGLVDATFMVRRGGRRGRRRHVDLVHKESRRWLDGAHSAAGLKAAGAARVTVVADRECDTYEDFACRPAEVEMLVRAGQDRRLMDGSGLFAKAETLPEAGRMDLDLPAAPWLLARLADGIQKVIRKEGTLLLENRKR